ncbi:restriction endonuclease subunit S [Amycolatopsis sp. cmx-4-83]|uniref:restriction endonuclease subunit S n=1 Tax=Amycolatopsis sp. cmx-4-83 TaxID=2790940 RepID=UPI003979B916
MTEWTTTTIGSVITLQRGFDITREQQRPGKVPVISSGGISSFHDTPATQGPGVVIGRKGTLGKVFYTDENYWPHDTTLWVKDFKGNSPRFVYYFLSQLNTLKLNVGSANPTLNRNHVHPIQIEWPSVSEQHAIVRVLDALDNKININARIAAKGNELSTSLPIRNSNHFTTLSRLVTHSRMQIDPASLEGRLVDHYSLPAFDTSQMPETCASTKIKSSKFLIQGEALLVSKLNPRIPRIWQAFPRNDRVALASTEFLVLTSAGEATIAEIWAVCSQPHFTAELSEKVTGTSNSHQRVNPKEVLAAKVLDPRSLPDSARNQIKILTERVQSARLESVLLAEIRDTLLPKLVSGELRVKDAERLVESAI